TNINVQSKREPSRREVIGGLSLMALGAAASLSAAESDGATQTAGASQPGSLVYPDDAFSRPLEDRWNLFETLDGIGPAADPITRATQFTMNTLRLEKSVK